MLYCSIICYDQDKYIIPIYNNAISYMYNLVVIRNIITDNIYKLMQ